MTIYAIWFPTNEQDELFGLYDTFEQAQQRTEQLFETWDAPWVRIYVVAIPLNQPMTSWYRLDDGVKDGSNTGTRLLTWKYGADGWSEDSI